jgi:SAM-dependent methyltransferase
VDRLPHRELALDLGCATGRTAEFLQPYFRNIIGIDVCPQMIDHAKGRRSWAPNVAFQVADLQERIPVEDGSASFVAATFGAASEVSSDLLSEVRRVLVPGGKAFLSFYNSNAISNLWYYPWPSTMRAHLNTYNDTLEVWYEGKVYVVRGVGMKPQDLQAECEAKGLVLQGMGTFPTFVSILPRFFFSSSRFHSLVKAVTDADKELARSKPYRGTYLTAVVTK